MNRSTSWCKFRRPLVSTLIIWAGCLGSAFSVKAQTIILDFEDLSPTGTFQPMPNGYGCINWSGVFWPYDAAQDPFNPSSGIVRIASNRVLREENPIIPRGQFQFVIPDQVFNGAWFAGPSPPQVVNVRFELYNDGDLVHSSATLQMSPVPTFLDSGYSGPVDAVTIVGPEGEYVFDDLSYWTASPCDSEVPSDSEVPIISGAAASPTVLWPPNHKAVDVAIEYTAMDDSGSVECTLGPVTSNETLDPSDWAILDAHHVRLVAEREGSGIGRLYTIPITCVDPSGNTTSEPIIVSVPHDRRSMRCVSPPEGLTGWWPGDGDAKDIVGSYDGVLRDDTRTGAGIVDRAFVLDGHGDFVDIPHNPALNFGTDDFTVDLWIYFKDTGGEQVLAEKWIQRFSGPSEGWTFTKLEDNTLLLAMSDPSVGGEVAVGTVLPIPARRWNHFAATRAGDLVTLFFNGVPVAAEVVPTLNVDSLSSLKFGHRGGPEDTPDSEDDSGFYLNGRIDEVEIAVGVALAQEEIQGIFNAGRAGKCKE